MAWIIHHENQGNYGNQLLDVTFAKTSVTIRREEKKHGKKKDIYILQCSTVPSNEHLRNYKVSPESMLQKMY